FLTGFTTSTQSFPVSFPQDAYEQDYNAGGTEGFIGRLSIGALVNSQEIESSADRLTLFPNPATDLLTISLPKDVKPHQREAHIYDMAGKLVMTKGLNHFETKITIGNLPSGLYQVRVEEFAGKFIKI
ncbi:MAG: T9SS type A sorting domain-containing protein, partial [Phaeodactylibacter sp.]|nr:T9SS type A sorting domain-containing protein [Phaeodactylibacter sp.]